MTGRRAHPWLTSLLEHIRTDLADDLVWGEAINRMESGTMRRGIHLAIFVEPYLSYILEGKKTIESRFGVTRRAPYRKVREGDILILKRSGGPVQGICEVSQVWFYELDKENRGTIEKDFAAALCAQDPSFWRDRKCASFATLMRIRNVRPLRPFNIPKKDRRGWIHFSGQDLAQDALF